MKTTFVSTQAVSNATRLSIIKMQSELAQATKEMSSGRLADVGLGLGARTGHSVQLRQELSQINTILDTNALVRSRLDTSQAALDGLLGTAEDFLGLMIAVRDGSSGGEVVKLQASLNLSALAGTLNSNMNGQYLFAGTNTDVLPMTPYASDPPSAAKTAVDNAFLTFFGFPQTDPAVATISAVDMGTFLDTAFADLFADPAWGNNWSEASDQNVRSRISTNELIETSANANERAFRQLAMAYTMFSDLGVENLQVGALQAIADRALSAVGGGLQDLTSIQARLGVSQNRVANASERLSIQRDIMSQQVVGLENVDLFETSTRVNTLMSQVELSYSLTARIRQLSLLKYM
jgi:flagellar hook-associated protein 3 FlgL